MGFIDVGFHTVRYLFNFVVSFLVNNEGVVGTYAPDLDP
jgi:hypothetical protein